MTAINISNPRGRTSNFDLENEDLAQSMPNQSNFALSAPSITQMGERKSELSASLIHPSPLESYKPPANQYRNIKARYFQSLNLASPNLLKNKIQEEKTEEPIGVEKPQNVEEEPKRPAEPIMIKSHQSRNNTNNRGRRATTNSPTGLYGGFSPAPEVHRTTEPVAIKKPQRPSSEINSVRSKLDDNDTDTDLDSTGSEYDDTFMFESTPNEVKSRQKQKYKSRGDDDLGRTYTPFLPPHLMNQRSDFSLYRQDQRRNILRKVEKFV